jgi:hypothetical protein
MDVIIGVRNFGTKPFFHKPFTKLINAWRAGVPAILSPDSAYQLLRKSELDYIEVKSQAELVEALKRLKQDKHLIEAMVTNGLLRAKELDNSDIAMKWRNLLDEVAPQALRQWAESKPRQSRFLSNRHLNAIRLEVERSILESYAPWLRNRPFDLDELKCETKSFWTEARRKIANKLINRQ